MNHLHLDCFSGLAGDMFLGACLDLGLPLSSLQEAVWSLDLRQDVSLEARRGQRGGLSGVRFRVLVSGVPIEGPDPEEGAPVETVRGHPPEQAPHHEDPQELTERESSREWSRGDLRAQIASSGLEAPVKARSHRLLDRLFEAVGRVRGVVPNDVRFHELGAIDALVDLVGAAVAVRELAVTRITCGPVNAGGGRPWLAASGASEPPPAIAELLPRAPIHGGSGGELLTPTGVALLAELVDAFGEPDGLRPEAVGYGLGRAELAAGPNAVRLGRGRFDPTTVALQQHG